MLSTKYLSWAPRLFSEVSSSGLSD